jgi:hypothetical protein
MLNSPFFRTPPLFFKEGGGGEGRKGKEKEKKKREKKTSFYLAITALAVVPNLNGELLGT